MSEKRKYGLFVKTKASYEEALEATKAALKEQGFGVLTEIDVRATMKEKLGAEFRRYDIIGACNPPLAHQALQTEIEIGLLLPCNVVVYESEAGTRVAVINAAAMLAMVDNDELGEVAGEVQARLDRVLAAL